MVWGDINTPVPKRPDSGPLEDVVRERYAWLYSKFGFRKVAAEYSSKYFGNSVLVLQSEGIRMRLDRDRGLVSMQLASLQEPESWHSARSLYRMFRGEPPADERTLSWCLHFLRDNLPAFEAVLSEPIEASVFSRAQLEESSYQSQWASGQIEAFEAANRRPSTSTWWSKLFSR